MKCKTFKIPLQNETGTFEELKFNKFLETVALSQVFASVVSNEFWSIVVFYEESATTAESFTKTQNFVKERQSLERRQPPESFQTPKILAEKPAKPEIAPPEPIVLTAEQEKRYTALRNWRNEQAGQNGLAPYMIAHNDSLMQIAILEAENKEDLLQIRGFGEKRVEKYGDEILQALKQVSKE